MPLISVVIPSFNRAYMIADALASVERQTYRNWEVIVVDDGSTDDLAAVLLPYQGSAKVRLVSHATNLGVSAARNTGVDASEGEFIAFLDSDDAWLPSKLEKQLGRILEQPDPMLAFCTTQTRIVMPGGWERVRPQHGPAPGQSFAEYLYNDGGFAQTSTFLVSRQLARQVGFCEDLRQYEDHLFFIKAGALGASYACVCEPLSIWRNDDRPDRLCATEDTKRMQRFFEVAGPLVSARARLGLEVWSSAPKTWSDAPFHACSTLVRAWRHGALPLPRIAAILLRLFAPLWLYDRVRRML